VIRRAFFASGLPFIGIPFIKSAPTVADFEESCHEKTERQTGDYRPKSYC